MTRSKQTCSQLLFTLLLCVTLSACGVGKFFIERAVNGIEKDVANEFKDFADFSDTQEREIEAIASEVAEWIRQDRLPALADQLDNFADDILSSGQLSDKTWDNTMRFMQAPMRLSSVLEALPRIAHLVHGMTESQIQDAIDKLQDAHDDRADEYADFEFSEQNKKLAKGLKTVFSEIGIARSKQQIARAREMLAQRKSHHAIEWQADQLNHQKFIRLLANRAQSKEDFTAQFMQAWEQAEQGPSQLAPAAWQHNASVTQQTLNYLLSDLSAEQQSIAAQNIREYVELLRRLAR